MRITRENTMLMVVDMQSKLIPVIDNNKQVTDNTVTLIQGLKELKVPIIVTEQYKKGLGDTIEEISNVVGEFEAYEKITFSAYEDEKIKSAIMRSGMKNIVLCGAEAHVCVLHTLIDLIDADYQVVLVEDCIGSRFKKDKEFAVKRAEHEGAIVVTFEQLLFELTRVAGTDIFKKIINLVKYRKR